MSRETTLSFVERVVGERDRFLRSVKDARATQASLLGEILARNRDTAFGRAHGFASIDDHASYVRAVPVRSYEELLPWLARTIGGERNVLTAAPAKLYLSTTGSTGDPKIFPVTQAYLLASTRNTMVFWGGLVERFPELLERDDSLVALHLMPREYSERTAAGIPVHRLIHMAPTVKGALPFTRTPWYPPPPEIDYRDLTYYLLRASVEHPLRGFICMHSSRLTGLLYALQRDGDRLVEEVAAGTLLGAPFCPPNAARARELAALVARGALSPRYVWPTLTFTTAWRGGTYDLIEAELDAGYGVPSFPYPCTSTEAGHINLPVDLSMDGPLTIQTNYYEFRPIGGEDAGGPTLTFDELEVGQTYEMIFTSPSGLYRYGCGDLFRVVGKLDDVPRVEFVARHGAVNLTGEKLSETQAQLALAHALAASGLRAHGATICACWGSPPFYTAVFEPDGAWSERDVATIAALMDDFLHETNSRYAWKRDWQELAAPRVRTVRRGTFARFLEHEVAQGKPLPSLKERPLHGELETLALYEALDRSA